METEIAHIIVPGEKGGRMVSDLYAYYGKTPGIGFALTALLSEDLNPDTKELIENFRINDPRKPIIFIVPESFASAQAAEFVLAHEFGHIALGHMVEDPKGMTREQRLTWTIEKEIEADGYAVAITGNAKVAIQELERVSTQHLSPNRQKERDDRIAALQTLATTV